MMQTQSSQDGLAQDAVRHDAVSDTAGEVVEQIRRMLANPRRTRR